MNGIPRFAPAMTCCNCRPVIFLLLLALAWGCSASPETAFEPRTELSEFPTLHREQIASATERYFGTPVQPRFMRVAAEQPEMAKEPALEDHVDRRRLALGRDVYQRQCQGCHGVTGDGQGPAAQYLNPPPRDYRLGRFKFTSTPRGSKPRREDLARIIRRGAKGTSMPSFRWMPAEEMDAVIDYVILLSSRGELEYRLMRISEQELGEEDNIDPFLVAENAQLIAASWDSAASQIVQPLTAPTPNSPESIEAGARAFVQLNCFKCHGPDGRGNKAQDVGKDDWGRVAFAADLTAGTLHGGRRPVDIYRRIYSGINGTPMPAFAQPDTGKGETEQQRSETIWNLTHFITSVVEGRPLPTEIIDAEIKELLKNQPAAESSGSPAAGGG
jgi:mono/diheme cytochrome c family protein